MTNSFQSKLLAALSQKHQSDKQFRESVAGIIPKTDGIATEYVAFANPVMFETWKWRILRVLLYLY